MERRSNLTKLETKGGHNNKYQGRRIIRTCFQSQVGKSKRKRSFYWYTLLTKVKSRLHKQFGYIAPSELEAVIKYLSTRKIPELEGFNTDFQRRANANTLQIIPWNRKRRNIVQFFFMKSQLLLRAKSHKDPTRKDKYRLISLMNLDAEFFIKYLQI